MGLADTLRSLGDVALAEMLVRRPELVDPPVANFDELANRASTPYSLQQCLAQLRAPVRAVIDALGFLHEPSTLTDVAALAAEPPDLALLQGAIDAARDLGLLVIHHLSPDSPVAYALAPMLARVVSSPFDLRFPLVSVLERFTVPDLRTIVENLGDRMVATKVPPKATLVAMVAARLSVPGSVAALLEHAPEDAGFVLQVAHELGGVADFPTSPYHREQLPEAVRWLLGHALLVPVDWDTVVVPREIAIELRGGKPLRAYPLVPPGSGGTLDDDLVMEAGFDLALDEHLGLAGAGLLGPTPRQRGRSDRVAREPIHELAPAAVVATVVALVSALAREPVKALRNGGIPVKDVRSLAKGVGLDDDSTARLLDLGGHAGLLGNDWRHDTVTVTDGFANWLDLTPVDRWLELVRTWQELSTTLAPAAELGDSRVAPLEPRYGDEGAVWRRAFVMAALGDVEPAAKQLPPSLSSVVEAARWYAPGRWHDVSDVAAAVRRVLAEAAILGLVHDGRLSELGAATLFAGNDDAACRAAGGQFPAPITTFTVQSDLTAVAPGELEASIASTLGGCAELESRGGAAIYRFTEASLRRAYDRGDTAETILRFLEEHARPSVPQALGYLVDDVARRHGRVRVGTATSYVRVEDAALLAEIVRHRKLSKLGLREIAPTVAVAGTTPAKLLAGLRDAGFLPVEEDDQGVVVARVTGPVPHRQGKARRDHTKATVLWAGLRAEARVAAPVRTLDGFPPRVKEAVRRLRSERPRR